MPLWDLVYLLADALPAVAGVPREPGPVLDLFCDRSPLSPLLFSHVRRAVHELGLPADSVGPLVTLGWLHHGLSPGARNEAARTAGATTAAVVPVQARLARGWLQDPMLGPGWSAWQ